jgi:ribosomal protein S18 acetylase RimI-like enzyme
MDRTLVIRDAQKSDVVALSELAIQTYSDAFGHTFSDSDLAAHVNTHLTPDHFSRILDEEVVLLAEAGDRMIGFVQFGAATSYSSNKSDQAVHRLYVLAEFQNQGYGAALMEAALRHPRLKEAPSIYLDVWEHNHGAQRFYRRYGFEVVGSRAFAVESGAPTSLDFVMVRRSRLEG